MNQPTALIAEDEPLLRDELLEALAAVWPELRVLGAAEDGIAAIRMVEQHQPDVLFLDIQMPGMSGLEVARAASGRCHVVFVTAYDQYAVSAFEEGAVDYVMKPFSAARLVTAVSRLKAKLHTQPANLDGMLQALAARPWAGGKPFLRWITASQGQNVKLITVEEICYFKSDAKYTLVVTADSESLIRTPIKELIDQVDPEVFWQIHRGTVVNASEIASVHRDFSGKLEVRLKRRKEALAVSESYFHLFRQM